MASRKDRFDLNNSDDVDMIRNIILCNNDSDYEDCDSSDTDCEDYVEQRQSDSETDQSIADESDFHSFEGFYLGKFFLLVR